jgi:hypothetical protein
MWHYLPMTTLNQAAPWARWLLRVTVTVEALLALGQPILIGAFLQGHYGALGLHQTNATLTGAAAGVMAVAAIVYWRPGRGRPWPAWLCLVIVAAVVVQIILGYSRVLAIHIPLGVLIVTADLLLAVWVWRPSR